MKLYFYVRTTNPLSPSTDPNWMELLVDADHDPTTGWNGFDFLINRTRTGSTCSIEKNVGGTWTWQSVGSAPIHFANNEIDLAVDRSLLGVIVRRDSSFDFKWADNLPAMPTAMDFIDKGDTAPDGRFKYRFVEDAATAPGPGLGADAGAGQDGRPRCGRGRGWHTRGRYDPELRCRARSRRRGVRRDRRDEPRERRRGAGGAPRGERLFVPHDPAG